MKRIAWLFLVVLGSALLVHAQSSTKPTQLSGTICQSTCVTQVDNVSTCDKGCTDKSGEAVLVDDQGNVNKIAAQSQNMCKSHMGKHVKMTAVGTGNRLEKDKQQEIRIMQLNEEGGAG